ncbi:MAG: prepilin-type N-terminal cleavage/methylation domain-containing protein [Chthoniobacteraceae bacterium]
MRPDPLHSSRCKAFTLLELLVVISIMALVIAFSRLALQGVSSSGKFNASLSDVSGILEQARAYAIAQNTYVWVVFYEYTPPNGSPLEVYAGAFGSNDGTDIFNWAGTPAVPQPGLTSVTRLYHFRGLHLQTTTLPNAPTGTLNTPATAAPIFQIKAQSDSGQISLPTSPGAVYWVIQFTPAGAARNAANPIDSIWLGLQPSFSPTAFDTHNVASLKVNGFTGLTTIYRQ